MVIIGSNVEHESDDRESVRDSKSELSVELIREREITSRMSELHEYEEQAESLGMSLPDYMGGGYSDGVGDVVSNPIKFKENLDSAGVKRVKSAQSGVKSISKMAYNEEDESPAFKPEEILGRSKFYLALGNHEAHSPADVRQQQVFLENLIIASTHSGIDIAWKLQDHGFDYPDIYTTNPDGLRDIIVTMYHSDHYPRTMWNDVPRVFQAQIGGDVPVEHIGMVQEPSATGVETVGSHSIRMRRVGEAILEYRAGGMEDREAFMSACDQVGVRPEAPWLLNERAQNEFLSQARARQASEI